MRFIEIYKWFRLGQWWHTKIPFLLFWVLIGYNGVGDFITPVFFVWLLSLCGVAGFGYFINDIFDIELDLESGKNNITSKLSNRNKLITVLFLFFLSILPWFLIEINWIVIVLVVLELFLFLLYSLTPIRFKDRKYLGMLADSLYAFVIPVFITVILFFNVDFDSYWLVLLFLWAFTIGLRNIISHHINDKVRDKGTATFNIANVFSEDSLRKGIKFILIPFEIIIFFGLLYFLPLKEFQLCLMITFTVFIIFYLLANSLLDKYLEVDLNQFYEGWPFFVILFFIGLGSWYYFLILGVFLGVFFRNSFILTFAYPILHFVFYKIIYTNGSKMLWSFYYSFSSKREMAYNKVVDIKNRIYYNIFEPNKDELRRLSYESIGELKWKIRAFLRSIAVKLRLIQDSK